MSPIIFANQSALFTKCIKKTALPRLEQRLIPTASSQSANRIRHFVSSIDADGARSSPLARLRRVSLTNSRSMVMVTQSKTSDSSLENKPAISSSSSPFVETTTATTAEESGDRTVRITDSCFKRIQQLALKKNQSLSSVYLRVFVDAGGCSGFQYQFEMTEEPVEPNEDVVFHDPALSGARVVIDLASLELMHHSTIDYVQEMIKSSFEVRDNPQSESACGCGSSFAVKKFAVNPALD